MWLWGSLTASGAPPPGTLSGQAARIDVAELAGASIFGDELESLRGRCVLLAAQEQLAAALAMVELDGVARRIVLIPPGLAAEHLPGVISTAEVDAVIGDDGHKPSAPAIGLRRTISPRLIRSNLTRQRSHDTEWILLTSGTTGAPKLVLHTLASLTSAFDGRPPPSGGVVWATFYDIRRYGGLQIFLRGLYGGSLVLSSPGESTSEFLRRAGAARVTHISGTPSHWRKALMSGATSYITPQYVRLSGEIADQAILDGLRQAYPGSTVAHAFASTEAGVGFEVRDGRAGFPASLISATRGISEIDVAQGTLRLRSGGNASCYLGNAAPNLRSSDGFVDTGDLVEHRDDRYYFVGRSGGVINVGGLKVHPEEVEAVINSHPRVRMSLVKGRRNPITGAVVTAEIVLKPSADGPDSGVTEKSAVEEIQALCRTTLSAHKVPISMRIVAALEVSPSGKLVRPNA